MNKVSYAQIAKGLLNSGVNPQYIKVAILEAELAATEDADTAARIMAILATVKG